MRRAYQINSLKSIILGIYGLCLVAPAHAADSLLNDTKRNSPSIVRAYSGNEVQKVQAEPVQGEEGAAASGKKPAEEKKSPWNFTAGGGLAFAPKYEGSKEHEIQGVPVLEATYDNGKYFAGTTRGLGMSLIQTETFQGGVSLGGGNGRREKDSRHLRGLGNIDGGLSASLFAKITPMENTDVSATVSRDFGDSEGVLATVSAGYTQPFSKELSLETSVGTTWMNDDYASSFFGVTKKQSARTGGRLKPFNAEAGLKNVSMDVGLNYQFSESWLWYNGVSVSRLMGDAGDSPITQEKWQTSYISAVAYSF